MSEYGPNNQMEVEIDALIEIVVGPGLSIALDRGAQSQTTPLKFLVTKGEPPRCNQVFAKAIPGLVVSDDVLANRRGGGLRHCEITDPAGHPAIIFPDDDHGGPNDPR